MFNLWFYIMFNHVMFKKNGNNPIITPKKPLNNP